MFRFIRRLMGSQARVDAELELEAEAELELSEREQLIRSVEELLRSGRPLMLENKLSGWFNDETGELYQGFQVVPEDTVLDVGCGDSPFVSFCAAQGAEVIFADIDAAKIASLHRKLAQSPARELLPLVTDANPLPLVDGVASKIIAMEVLEHVDDPQQFMAELVRVGKSGARYLLTVPGFLHENIQKNLAPDSYFEKPNHIRIFQQGELEKLATEAGLKVESFAGYGFYWSIWWYLFWACEQDLSDAWHPMLENWTRTWLMLLKSEQGPRIKSVLDEVMPKSYAIVATKP